MYIGVIIGTVVATRKDEKFVGHKLLLTQPVNVRKEPIGEPLVAIDTVGAGIGEFIFFTKGTAARYAANKPDSPIDAAVVGIIDGMDLDDNVLKNQR